MKYNLKFLGEDIGFIFSLLDVEFEFKEVIDSIEVFVVESGMKFVVVEKEEIEKMVKVFDLKLILNLLEIFVSEMYFFFMFNFYVLLFGVGLVFCWGFFNIVKGI